MSDPRGPEIKNSDKPLYRNVHPDNVDPDDGKPSSQAFLPHKDDNFTSIHDGRKVNAEQSFERHRAKELETIGAWSMPLAGIQAAGVRVHEDPDPKDDAHAVIDMRGKGGGAQRTAARALKKIATQAHPPPTS